MDSHRLSEFLRGQQKAAGTRLISTALRELSVPITRIKQNFPRQLQQQKEAAVSSLIATALRVSSIKPPSSPTLAPIPPTPTEDEQLRLNFHGSIERMRIRRLCRRQERMVREDGSFCDSHDEKDAVKGWGEEEEKDLKAAEAALAAQEAESAEAALAAQAAQAAHGAQAAQAAHEEEGGMGEEGVMEEEEGAMSHGDEDAELSDADGLEELRGLPRRRAVSECMLISTPVVPHGTIIAFPSAISTEPLATLLSQGSDDGLKNSDDEGVHDGYRFRRTSERFRSVDPHIYIGRTVHKYWNLISYSGTVTAFDPKTRFFKVLYDDGDVEEYYQYELNKLLREAPLEEELLLHEELEQRGALLHGSDNAPCSAGGEESPFDPRLSSRDSSASQSTPRSVGAAERQVKRRIEGSAGVVPSIFSQSKDKAEHKTRRLTESQESSQLDCGDVGDNSEEAQISEHAPRVARDSGAVRVEPANNGLSKTANASYQKKYYDSRKASLHAEWGINLSEGSIVWIPMFHQHGEILPKQKDGANKIRVLVDHVEQRLLAEDLRPPLGRLEDDLSSKEWLKDSLQRCFQIDTRAEIIDLIDQVKNWGTCPSGTRSNFFSAAKALFEGNDAAIGAINHLENPANSQAAIVTVFFYGGDVASREDFRGTGGLFDLWTIAGKAPMQVPGPNSDVIIANGINMFNGGWMATWLSQEDEEEFRKAHGIAKSRSIKFSVPLLILAKLLHYLGRFSEEKIALQRASECVVSNLGSKSIAPGLHLSNRLDLGSWYQFTVDRGFVCDPLIAEISLCTIYVASSTRPTGQSRFEPLRFGPSHPRTTKKHPDARAKVEVAVVQGRTLMRATLGISYILNTHVKLNREREDSVLWLLVTSPRTEEPGVDTSPRTEEPGVDTSPRTEEPGVDKVVCFATYDNVERTYGISILQGNLNSMLFRLRDFPQLSSDISTTLPVGQTGGVYHIGTDTATKYKKHLYAHISVTHLTDDGTIARTSMFPPLPLRLVSGSQSSSASSASSGASSGSASGASSIFASSAASSSPPVLSATDKGNEQRPYEYESLEF